MDSFDNHLQKVIESAITTSVEVDLTKSLQELYNGRKEELQLSDRQIQKILGMDRNTLLPILDGTGKQVNFINLIKLAHFLKISVNDLIKLYVPKMDSKLIGELERSRQAGYLIEYFDVSTLTKMNFFKKDSSSQEMTDRITRFFNIDLLFDYDKSAPFTAFSRSKRSSNDMMRNFWVHSAIVQFQYINNPNGYNREGLLELIPKIRPYTRDRKHGLIKVIKALYNVGVTVLFQESILNLQVRGATISVHDKPCIVLSDVQKNYPTLWFTLLHELHHVLFDFEEIQKRVYHISSAEGDLFLMDEEKADTFAREYLLNATRVKYASKYMGSPYHIEKLAQQWSIHPSIIYAFHCYDTNEWPFYSKYIPKMDDAIELLNTHPFEKETLVESAEELKRLIFN